MPGLSNDSAEGPQDERKAKGKKRAGRARAMETKGVAVAGGRERGRCDAQTSQRRRERITESAAARCAMRQIQLAPSVYSSFALEEGGGSAGYGRSDEGID